MGTALESLGRRLVGRWTTEAKHPAMPGTTIAGSSQFEWLDGEQFLIFRSHYDHPDFPDAISIIGDTDGLQMHYFDTRGVHRLFELTVSGESWMIAMSSDAHSRSWASGDRPFSQRMTFTFEQADQKMSGKGELSYDDVNWDDDLEVVCQRES